jgi:HEAT repeat protein
MLAVVVAFAAGLAGTVKAQQANEQKILDAFKKGVTLYQTGEYAAAKEAFGQVLAMEPDSQAALKMHDMAELSELFSMESNAQLKGEAHRLLDLMTRAARERKRAIPDVAQVTKDFQSPELTVHVSARIKLIGHGPYAVPYVVPLLTLKAPDQQAIVARAESLLVALQRDSALPLAQVLLGTDDTLLKARVAAVLGQIGDVRAVPALLSVREDPKSLPDLKDAAARALTAITGKTPEELGTAVQQYVTLGNAYFVEDKVKVGYTYGLTGDIWEWKPSGANLTQKIAYEEVPNYLYYQRMATEVALEGLALAPGNGDLEALLAAGLVREMALCEYFKSSGDTGLSQDLADKVRKDAAIRATALEVEAPIVLRMLQTPVAAQALEMVLSVGDAPASLFVVKAIEDKLTAEGPGALDMESATALVVATDSGDKDVRYSAAITLVEASPTGEFVPAEPVMKVMSAALKAAAARNALVIMDNFQMRNSLVTLLRSLGVETTESDVLGAQVSYVLSIQPSVDIIFLAGNGPDAKFAQVMMALKKDTRTKSAPLYVVVDPAAPAPDMSKYEGIEGVLKPDDLRQEKLQPVLQEKVFAKKRSAFTEEEQAVVLRAARAVGRVDPLNTTYPLDLLEPSLIAALTGYSEEVTAAVVANLAAFGGEAGVEPLSKIAAGNGSLNLKAAALRAMAAVMKRAGVRATESVVGVLKAALASKDQPLRQAAAEAISAAGLPPGDALSLLRKEGLGEQ